MYACLPLSLFSWTKLHQSISTSRSFQGNSSQSFQKLNKSPQKKLTALSTVNQTSARLKPTLADTEVGSRWRIVSSRVFAASLARRRHVTPDQITCHLMPRGGEMRRCDENITNVSSPAGCGCAAYIHSRSVAPLHHRNCFVLFLQRLSQAVT